MTRARMNSKAWPDLAAGATIGQAVVWNGSVWEAADPLLVGDSTFGTYQLLMDVDTTSAELEAHVSTVGGFLGLTLLLEHATRWPTVVANGAATATILGSGTAQNAMLASSAGMTVFIASASMATAVNNSSVMTTIAASSSLVTLLVANTTAFALTAQSSVAMSILAASLTAMTAVAASSTAMTAVAVLSTAITAVYANSSAKAAFKASTALSVAAIPTMTSNTTPSGVASASTEYDGTYQAWKAFNKVVSGDAWIAGIGQVTNQWLKYDFGTARFIHSASVQGGFADGPNSSPKNIKIEYSDDDGVWTAAATAVHPFSSAVVSYDVQAAGKHRYWRLFCTNNNGSSNFMDVIEFTLTGFTW